MNFSNYIILTAAIFLTACASSETPSYVLTDSELHQYQGGDKLSYAVLTLNNTGILTHTYQSVDLVTPENQTFNALVRNIDTQGGIGFPFATPNFTQMENGNLIIEAYTEGGNTYWLTENETATTGRVFYTSPLSDITERTNTTSPLLVCNNENGNCKNGSTTNVLLIPFGKETVETEYAKFETYKFIIEWTVDIQANDQLATPKNYRLSGTQWVYPPLGVVKFTYDVGTGLDNVIGSLSSTNISIPDSNKSGSHTPSIKPDA